MYFHVHSMLAKKEQKEEKDITHMYMYMYTSVKATVFGKQLLRGSCCEPLVHFLSLGVSLSECLSIRVFSECEIHALSICFQDDDLSNYVHKQGFLVKQGRRVKNWKRRLFVLDSNGLSYYRTEQPINKVPLSDIKKIQVSHNQ